QKKIVDRCNKVAENPRIARAQTEPEDELDLGVNPEELPDILSYLKNCDILKTRPYFGHFKDEFYPLKV
ncbi:MAG: hypothetical protein Q8P15_00300, partial [Nanoarchaeota archaeon]|nr:hypothetical protein [Nanoarchaeota archaeon]